jgi:hypothetical protein
MGGGEDAPASRTLLGKAQGHKARGAMHGSGGGEGTPNATETGFWQSESISVPQTARQRQTVGKGGNRCPRDPLQGRRARAERSLEGPLGEPPGAPPVSMQLQRSAEQAPRSPAMVFAKVLHLIDGDVLREASRQPQKQSAPGGPRGRPKTLPSTWRTTSGTCMRGGVTIDTSRRRSNGYRSRRKGERRVPSGNPAARTHVSSGQW